MSTGRTQGLICIYNLGYSEQGNRCVVRGVHRALYVSITLGIQSREIGVWYGAYTGPYMYL